jgi:hypothetical protein
MDLDDLRAVSTHTRRRMREKYVSQRMQQTGEISVFGTWIIQQPQSFAKGYSVLLPFHGITNLPSPELCSLQGSLQATRRQLAASVQIFAPWPFGLVNQRLPVLLTEE